MTCCHCTVTLLPWDPASLCFSVVCCCDHGLLFLKDACVSGLLWQSLSPFVNVALHSVAIKPESPCFDACYLLVLCQISPLPQMMASCHQSWDCCWIGGSHCCNCSCQAQTDVILNFFINMEWQWHNALACGRWIVHPWEIFEFDAAAINTPSIFHQQVCSSKSFLTRSW